MYDCVVDNILFNDRFINSKLFLVDVSPDATKGSGLHDNEEILAISTEIVSAPENKLGTIDNQTDDKDKNTSTTEMTKNTNENIDKIELTTVTSNNNNDSNDNLNFLIELKENKTDSFHKTIVNAKKETITQNDSSLNKNTQLSKNQNLKRQLDSNDACTCGWPPI